MLEYTTREPLENAPSQLFFTEPTVPLKAFISILSVAAIAPMAFVAGCTMPLRSIATLLP